MSSTSHLSFETHSELQVCHFCGCIYLYISTTWRGSMAIAAPMYWFYHGPLLIHLFGSGESPSTFSTVCILFFQIQSKAIGAIEKSHTYVVVSNICLFSPLFGEDEPILTSKFFQVGWFNHQPDTDSQGFRPFSDLMPGMVFGSPGYEYNPLRLRYQPLIKFKWLRYWHISKYVFFYHLYPP